jgi:hypothetical protein
MKKVHPLAYCVAGGTCGVMIAGIVLLGCMTAEILFDPPFDSWLGTVIKAFTLFGLWSIVTVLCSLLLLALIGGIEDMRKENDK